MRKTRKLRGKATPPGRFGLRLLRKRAVDQSEEAKPEIVEQPASAAPDEVIAAESETQVLNALMEGDKEDHPHEDLKILYVASTSDVDEKPRRRRGLRRAVVSSATVVSLFAAGFFIPAFANDYRAQRLHDQASFSRVDPPATNSPAPDATISIQPTTTTTTTTLPGTPTTQPKAVPTTQLQTQTAQKRVLVTTVTSAAKRPAITTTTVVPKAEAQLPLFKSVSAQFRCFDDHLFSAEISRTSKVTLFFGPHNGPAAEMQTLPMVQQAGTDNWTVVAGRDLQDLDWKVRAEGADGQLLETEIQRLSSPGCTDAQ